ncbi:hypothetical protein DENSPDRAFT_439934 [Dentipellis sp. KUC8613]|nr:hypothetical protein DENSPDRAFT_439934 [Dentipellis sp. KUC8613]
MDGRKAKKPRLHEADGFAKAPNKAPRGDAPKASSLLFKSDFAPVSVAPETPVLKEKARVFVTNPRSVPPKPRAIAPPPRDLVPRFIIQPSVGSVSDTNAASSSRPVAKQHQPYHFHTPNHPSKSSSSATPRQMTVVPRYFPQPKIDNPPSTPPRRKPMSVTRAFCVSTPSPDTMVPGKAMKSISATRLARATDITNEDGAAELLGFFLQQTGSMSHTADNHPDITRGLEITPHKAKGGFGKSTRFLRGGLAERAHENLGRTQMTLTLWHKEVTAQAVSTRHASANILVQIKQVVYTSPSAERPRGPAGCRFCLAVCSPLDSNESDRRTIGVLFSLSNDCTPDLDGINARELPFRKNGRVAIWKPWHVVDDVNWVPAAGGGGDKDLISHVNSAMLCSRYLVL